MCYSFAVKVLVNFNRSFFHFTNTRIHTIIIMITLSKERRFTFLLTVLIIILNKKNIYLNLSICPSIILFFNHSYNFKI